MLQLHHNSSQKGKTIIIRVLLTKFWKEEGIWRCMVADFFSLAEWVFAVELSAQRQEPQPPQFRERKVCARCHALCGPGMGDNELSCEAATLPTVCGEEETGENDLQGTEAEAPETPPELKRESEKGQ